MEVSLFEKVDACPARDCGIGAFVCFRHTDLLGALTGDDGNALHVIVGHNNQTNQVELLSVADGQLRTCNPDRILSVVTINLHRQTGSNTHNLVRVKDLKPGSTFSLVERSQDEEMDYVVSGSKKSLPDNIRAYKIGNWGYDDFDNDRHVTPTRWVCEVIAS